MSRIEPTLVPVVTDLDRGLRELSIPFAIVGALVPELLLDARPARMTNDALIAMSASRNGIVVRTFNDADYRMIAEFRPFEWERV